MKTTQDLLDGLRAIAGSDRKAAPLVGVSQPAISRWRQGDDYPSDDNGRAIAQLLQLDPAHVLAIIHADRSKSEETRAIWQRVAATFAKAATVAVVAIGAGLGAPAPAQAGFDKTLSTGQGEYTLCPKRRRKAARARLGAFAEVCARTLGLAPRQIA